jgi:diadenosine tetraphosphate (Ap4A) HIT family hydrolase
MTFLLDSYLAADSAFVVDLALCQVRLSHNAAFPWILLIPKYTGIIEIMDLTIDDQQLLMSEIVLASRAMKDLFQPKKLNVASLGNIVSQLHVHIIARYENDKAWPGPVWNSGVNLAYDPTAQTERINQFKKAVLSLNAY